MSIVLRAHLSRAHIPKTEKFNINIQQNSRSALYIPLTPLLFPALFLLSSIRPMRDVVLHGTLWLWWIYGSNKCECCDWSTCVEWGEIWMKSQPTLLFSSDHIDLRSYIWRWCLDSICVCAFDVFKLNVTVLFIEISISWFCLMWGCLIWEWLSFGKTNFWAFFLVLCLFIVHF